MGWVRVSDDFYDHPAWVDLDATAIGVWIIGLAWANRNLTDGRIPAGAVKRMDPDGTASGALIAAGRWHRLEDGAVEIHDYLEYQPSAEQIRSKREKDRERWHRRGSSLHVDSTATPRGVAQESTSTPLTSQPQPQHSISDDMECPPARRGKTKIPSPFEVTPEMESWARERYPQLDWSRETEKFVAWAKANDRRYADWLQAWRNWMHRATEGGWK